MDRLMCFIGGLMIAMQIKANNAKETLTKKREGMDGLIITIGLILIVLVVLFFFKDKILNAMNNSMENIENKVGEVGNISY